MDKEFKRNELEHELRHEDAWNKKQASKPVLKGYYFYNIPQDADLDHVASLGIKQTKNGRYAMAIYDKSGYSTSYRKQLADSEFGPGKWWTPNKKTNEATGITGQPTISTTGQIIAANDKEVTIDNKNGTKTVVDAKSNLLAKDPVSGKLTLNKAAVQPQQQKPTVGQQVKLA